MKHAILGVGAIGGLVGTVLASLGEEVMLIVRPEQLAGYPDTLTLERPSGPLNAKARASASLSNPVDVLWIATKTYQLENALASVRETPRSIVPLLNGVDHVALLRERFGEERVIPGTIAVEAERLAPGRFMQRSPFVNLNLATSGEPMLASIIARLGPMGFTCKVIQNEQTLLWIKLCFLGPLALVTSASGNNIGEILGNKSWKTKLLSAIDEACAVANASGAQVDAARILSGVDNLPPGMRSSMQKDVVAGRQLELDAIGGSIARRGLQFHLDVSTIAGLMEAIRAKTALRS